MSAPVPGPPRPGPFGVRPGQQVPVSYPGPQAPASFPGGQGAHVEPSDGGAAAGGSGHPAVDAVLDSLANAAQLAPADQVAEYEAVHRVLQETLASIDRA